jgi:hypothetical protein
VLAAVSADAESFRYANKALRKDRSFVLEIAKKNSRAIFHAVSLFKKDRDVVLAAAIADPDWALRFADVSLHDDPILRAMVLGAQVGIKPIYIDGKIENIEEIVSKGLSNFGSSVLGLASHFSKPHSSVHWQQIVRAKFVDLVEQDIYRACHRAAWSGRVDVSIDIVLMVSLSESMQPCLDAFVTEIPSMLSRLDYYSKEIPDSELKGGSVPLINRWRLKICGYRNVETSGDQWWQESPFLVTGSKICSYVNSLSLGANDCASLPLLDGLWKISNMPTAKDDTIPDDQSWSGFREESQADCRFVLVFSDAACAKETQSPEVGGAQLIDVLNAVFRARLRLIICAPEYDSYEEILIIDRSTFTRI